MDSFYFHFMVALATWRLSTLLTFDVVSLQGERGLFGIFDLIRRILGINRIKFDEMSKPIYPNELIRMLSCLWCTSVTVGFLFSMLQYEQLTYFEIFTMGLAYSSFAIFFDRKLRQVR